MSALLQKQFIGSLFPEIEQHAAWVGNVSALQIEKVLKQYSTPYLYALRAGENKGDYYVTYIDPNAQHNKIVHRPFVVTLTSEGWYYENSGGGGPYIDCTIDEVIHFIMHCKEWECVPFIKD
jgi:hypothetical protein